MSRTRIAIIGLGMAVGPHAGALIDLSQQVECVAGFSPTEARRQAFAQTYGLPVVDDMGAILSDPAIDAVIVLTPPHTHLQIVRQAAASGKHVLLEKPLDISLERAETLVALMRDAGLQLGVVLQNRFRPASLALAGILAEGRLGSLISASARIDNWRSQAYYDESGRGSLARDGGGVLLTQAIHTIDLLIAFAGLPAEVMAYAATSSIHRMETEDIVACAMRFPQGAMGTIDATTCAYPGSPERIELIGSHGTALLVGPELTVRFHDGTSISAGEPASGPASSIMGFGFAAHRALIADFADAIATGRPPLVDGAAALRAHDLIAAMLQSAAAASPVPVRHRR